MNNQPTNHRWLVVHTGEVFLLIFGWQELVSFRQGLSNYCEAHVIHGPDELTSSLPQPPTPPLNLFPS